MLLKMVEGESRNVCPYTFDKSAEPTRSNLRSIRELFSRGFKKTRQKRDGAGEGVTNA